MWLRDGHLSSDFVLLGPEKMPLAKFEHSTWAVRKEGKLHLMGQAAMGRPGDGGLLDEICLSGLAEVEYEKRRNRSASSGGGGGC